ncbi:MAG: PilZ domain-containing protein [Bdellovibrionales bacterium]|nr:PilZ domain-containing protein [Bdellovibrionales bacterium]
MTNKKWFLNINSHVTGPLTTKDLEKNILNQPTALIWGRGFPEWITVPAWKEKLLNLKTLEKKVSDHVWKYRLNGVESQGSDLESMILELKTYPELQDLELWSSKKPGWRVVYTVPEVADPLGLSRRNHSRVPVMGTYTGEGPAGPFKCTVYTLSEGGMGLADCDLFAIGDSLKGVLSSPNLLIEINCFCEVVFVGQDGNVGLTFVSLPMEAQSIIIEYVHKFEEN